jgi:uncharacterized protein YbjT (DUF2867 family)
MAENDKTALLAGATGLVGREVLNLLLADPVYSQVTVLTRRPLGMEHPKLQEVIVDFNKLPQYAAVMQADDVYCCLGTTIKQAGSQAAFRLVDQVYPTQMAEIAQQKGAKQFLIVTAMGASDKSLIFYNRVKGEVETALAQMPYDAVQILRPSLLIGQRQQSRAGEGVAQTVFNLINPLMAGPLKKYRAISGKQVAKAMVAIAKSGTRGVNRYENDALINY